MRGFTVALSRSRVVNYSRPKGIEKATSLLRCVRNPANPFSLLPLSLSLSLYRLVDSNIRRRNGGYGPEKEDEEREERKKLSSNVSFRELGGLSFGEIVSCGGTSRFMDYRISRFHPLESQPCPVNIGFLARSDPRLSLSFKIFRGYCHEASYCSIEKR